MDQGRRSPCRRRRARASARPGQDGGGLAGSRPWPSRTAPDRRRRALQAAGGAAWSSSALLLWWLLPLGRGRSPSGTVTFAPACPPASTSATASCSSGDLAEDLPDVTVRLQTSEGSPAEHRAGGRRARPTSPSPRPTRSPTTSGTTEPGADGCAPARGCTTTTCSWSCPRGSPVQSVAGPAGQAGRRRPGRLGRAADRRPAAEGGRARPGKDITPVPIGHRHDAGAAAKRQARRLLLVRRAADRPRCSDLARSGIEIRLVQLGDLVGRAARAGRRDALLPGGGDARRRVPAAAAAGGRQDDRGGRICWSPRTGRTRR